MKDAKLVKIHDIIDRYDTLLIDAYGVLVNQGGAIPGAQAFLELLHHTRKPYFLLTNDASRAPQTIAKRFAGFGLTLDAGRMITSGSLLTEHFRQTGLQGARCMVFGTADSRDYVKAAGGLPTVPDPSADAEVMVVCDDAGFDFLPGVEAAVTVIMRRHDAGKATHLVLCNPDIIYPKGGDGYGLTCGAIALLIEAALRVRYVPAEHGALPQFARLGKPFSPIFAAAAQHSGTRNMLMLGDQLATDIRGAHDFGIDSVLMCTGLTLWRPGMVLDPAPTYVCADLT